MAIHLLCYFAIADHSSFFLNHGHLELDSVSELMSVVAFFNLEAYNPSSHRK